MYCFGCRRFLCMEPPKVEAKFRKKHPNFFAVDTPVIADVPKARDDGSGGNFTIVKEIGEWTCYHVAHQKGWNIFLQLHKSDIVGLARGERDLEEDHLVTHVALCIWGAYIQLVHLFVVK